MLHRGCLVVCLFVKRLMNFDFKCKISSQICAYDNTVVEVHMTSDTQYTGLDLSANDIRNDNVAELFERYRPVGVLLLVDVSSNHLDESGVKNLFDRLPDSVERIDLSRNLIKPKGLQSIGDRLKRMKALCLNSTGLGNDGAEFLSENIIPNNTKIETLEIDYNAISEGGAKMLANRLKNGGQHISFLSFSGNRPGTNGVSFFGRMLKSNTKLLSLNMSNNSINDQGVNMLFEGLRDNRTLLQLNISGNNITTEGIKRVKHGLINNDTLVYLDLSRNNLDDFAVTHFADVLEKNKRLIALILSDNSFTSHGTFVLFKRLSSKICPLRILDLSGNVLGDEGALNLAGFLYECIFLVRLNLENCRIGTKGIHAIFRSSHSLKVLNLNWNTVEDTNNEDFEFFSDTRSLLCLHLRHTRITDNAVKFISNALLKTDCYLKELDLSDNEITDIGAASLSSAISVNKSIEQLNLSFNPIKRDGRAKIVDALGVNNTIKRFFFNGARIGKRLLNALESNRSLIDCDFFVSQKICSQFEKFLDINRHPSENIDDISRKKRRQESSLTFEPINESDEE